MIDGQTAASGQPTIHPNQQLILSKIVIPTGATRSGGTCSCFSLVQIEILPNSPQSERNHEISLRQPRIDRDAKREQILVESLAAIDSLLFSIHYFRHSGWMTAQPKVTPNRSWLPPGDRKRGTDGIRWLSTLFNGSKSVNSCIDWQNSPAPFAGFFQPLAHNGLGSKRWQKLELTTPGNAAHVKPSPTVCGSLVPGLKSFAETSLPLSPISRGLCRCAHRQPF